MSAIMRLLVNILLCIMNVHYYTDNQNREHRLTRDIVTFHRWAISDVLDLSPRDKIICEFDKRRYGAEGDVDIAVWKNPGLENEATIGIEVKVIHLNKHGEFKSYKEFKHNKQIEALTNDGWDYVFFFDFIVVEPSVGWFHDQAFDGFDKYSKEVESVICGHAVFQVNSVAHKPEAEAGSISTKLIKDASPNLNNPGRAEILRALREYNA
ncbi:hypothetical protein BMS3Abin07_02461 [bacterium BMS3Abin07]|nr:hypothetical protein BMS3Abin07_02461 [bacterium BMS3Abin07]